MNLVSFLNQNSGAVQSIFAGIVAVATAVYVFYTARMFGQMRYSNRRLEAANVHALLEPGRRQGTLFELMIRNSGNVPVYDVRIDVAPKDFPSLSGQSLGGLSLFSRPIPILTEGQEIRTILFHYMDYVESKTNSDTITFSVSFKTPQGTEETRTYPYDLSIYKELPDVSERSLSDVTKELKELRKELKKVSSGVDKVRGRIEWSIMFPSGGQGGEANPSTVLSLFSVCWEDYKTPEDKAFVGFSLYKLQALCERVHVELCRADGEGDEYSQIRRNLLKMARKNFYLDGGVSMWEFKTLGDETAGMISKMREEK